MSEQAWEPITHEAACHLMQAYWRRPQDVLADLQNAAMRNRDAAHLISVRTPWRFFRYNTEQGCFETLAVT